jgi:hypothetical protein
MFKETTLATAVNIKEIFPKGYECFPSNAARFITWSSAVPAGHKSSVSIGLSTSGLTGPWTVIDSAAHNTGKYQWQVPGAIASSDCYFRFIVTDSSSLLTDTAVNAQPFQIGVCIPTLGLNETAKTDVAIIAYPNPFTDATIIYGNSKRCTITVSDITGKVIRRILDVDLPFTLERDQLKAGVYLIIVQTPNGTISRLKAIAQ